MIVFSGAQILIHRARAEMGPFDALRLLWRIMVADVSDMVVVAAAVVAPTSLWKLLSLQRQTKSKNRGKPIRGWFWERCSGGGVPRGCNVRKEFVIRTNSARICSFFRGLDF